MYFFLFFLTIYMMSSNWIKLSKYADINSTRVLEKFSERFGSKIFYGKSGREDKLKLLIEDFKKTSFGKQFWTNNESVIQPTNNISCLPK